MSEKNIQDSKATPKKDTQDAGGKETNLFHEHGMPAEDLPMDVIPDEVPRKDGPGGEE